MKRPITALLVAALPTTTGAPIIECQTDVATGDGLIRIETFPETAPHGVKRLTELVESGFFDGMPFFRAIPNFLIQFGISPDAEKQDKWNRAGNIPDDPKSSTPFTDGIVSFAGYGKDSRSTHVFFTLGSQPGLGRSPWEVPVGKVTSGLDVMHGIYTGYGDRVDQGKLQPRSPKAKEYLQSFPKLSRITECRVKGLVEDKRVEL